MAGFKPAPTAAVCYPLALHRHCAACWDPSLHRYRGTIAVANEILRQPPEAGRYRSQESMRPEVPRRENSQKILWKPKKKIPARAAMNTPMTV
jgi:hypothetical protein